MTELGGTRRAVFGVTAGWERGLWYAQDSSERDLPYSVGAQPWQAIVERRGHTDAERHRAG